MKIILLILLVLIIAILLVLRWGSTKFENSFRKDVSNNQSRIQLPADEILTETDLLTLPDPVRKYLRYVGVLGKPKVRSVRVIFEGQMREKGKDYFPFMSEQFNYFDQPTRLFFMKAKMFGVTVPGYHHYSNGSATMDIRLFGLFSVVKKSGNIMDKAETVTVFNDMCLLAPATLIDKRIQWKAVDDTTAKAIFTNQNISISAMLFFNKLGQLVNFRSEDRSAAEDTKQHPFSTPVSEYKSIRGYQLMSRAETVWHYPDGKFTYGKFLLKDIEYNP